MQDIRDYFLIGDLHTVALVSKDGSIDWMCLPHFDSPSVFAKILDKQSGSFSIETNGHTVDSKYMDKTAIVETTFEKDGGKFTVKDFMVPQPKKYCETHFLVRRVTGISGNPEIKFVFNARPDYAASDADFKKTANALVAKVDDCFLSLHFPSGTKVKKTDNVYEIVTSVSKGESKKFILTYSKSAEPNIGHDFESVTKLFWRKWVAKGQFIDFCKNELIRSAITLKLMQFYPTGAIVAAPTTSLPEEIGGVRNWDYRYVWIRDATFTLYGLYVLGYMDEARKFFRFIESVSKECEECNFEVHLIYTIDGKPPPRERILKHMKGYKNSRPVRIGNAAAEQFQLDIFGSLIDAYYFMTKRGLGITKKGREVVIELVDRIAERWKEKDNGIWEIRGQKHHFTYGKVMAWVGIDRAIRLCDVLGISQEKKDEYVKLAQEIKDWIYSHCYDKKRKTFFQHADTKYQDATNFLFVLLQFLDKHNPDTRKVIENTAKQLLHKDMFVYRYLSDDGLKGKEGAFVLCTFWLISALAIIENMKEARRLFDEFNKVINDNGLMSEEMDPNNFDYLGNYPQAFSHIGYIMAAYYIHRYQKKLSQAK